MIQTHTLFISDLHLSPKRPDMAESFHQFMQQQAREADALYILGDFFDTWLGDDDLTPFNKRVMESLKQLSDHGTPIYYLLGNHDFMIGRRFIRKTGVTLIKDPTVIDLYGEKILLMHGDSLCTKDILHQKSRKKMHNKFRTVPLSWLPLPIRRAYGRRIEARSHHHKKTVAEDIMDVTPEEVTRVMKNANALKLIHGHTHRPAIHQIKVDHQEAQRVVLDSWHQKANALFYYSDGASSLRYLLE